MLHLSNFALVLDKHQIPESQLLLFLVPLPLPGFICKSTWYFYLSSRTVFFFFLIFLFLSLQHSTLSTSAPNDDSGLLLLHPHERLLFHMGETGEKKHVACTLLPSQLPFSSCRQHKGHFFTTLSNNSHEHSVGFQVKTLERV